nr:retroviral-like aspartic protease family protein [Roseomonas marmotae]
MRLNVPVVPVEVNGQRMPFVLDTGGTSVAVTPEAVQFLRLPRDPVRKTELRGTGGVSVEQNALLRRMGVGRRQFGNLSLPVAAHPLPGQRLIAGFLGANLLRASEVEMDIPSRRVVLHDARTCLASPPPWPGGYDTIPVEVLQNGWVLMTVELDGTAVPALLDTGAGHTSIRRSTAVALGVPEAMLSVAPARLLLGIGPSRMEARVHRFATVRIGQEVLRDMPVSVVERPDDFPFGIVLGQDYIGARRLWLCYARQSLYVQRPLRVTDAN